LIHLKNLTRIETLYLTKTEVTDRGLEHLEGMTRLRTLHVEGTAVTRAGLAKLREKCTQLQVPGEK
jgi:hypothetical protein